MKHIKFILITFFCVPLFGQTVTDIDGNVYQTVIIGNQEWMAENLKVSRYQNGDSIPTGYSNTDWSNLSTGAYAVYNDDTTNFNTYGYLYNWYAVNDTQNIAPAGWHVPTDDEYKELEMALGMSQSEADGTSWRGTNEGSQLAGNDTLWNSGNLENNSEFGASGFRALPSGYRDPNGSYFNLRSHGYFWSSTTGSGISSWKRRLSYFDSAVYRYVYNRKSGFSIRCIKDSSATNYSQTYVPDDNFEAYLEANGMGNGIANDDSVTTANIDSVITLDIASMGIADLTGIEDFLTLENLSCEWNNLTALDLSANILLDYLRCNNNSIATLNVNNSTQLTRLFCDHNQLTVLDVSNNSVLTHLFPSYNDLTELDVSANPLMEKINCGRNNITSLDVSQNPALWYFGCIENNLTSLDLRNGNNTILTAFNSTNNPDLTCIDVDNVAWADTALAYIDSWTSFSEDCSAGGGDQTYVPDDNFEAYLEANGMGNGIANDDSVLTANINTVTNLNVGNQGIADMTGLEDFTALISLKCNTNQLTSLDVSANTAITELWCFFNQLASLDVSANTAITKLRCNNNQLTSLDVSTNTALTELICSSNQLTSLDVTANTALSWLSCASNQLTSLNVAANTALTYLGCRNNQLSSLDLSANTTLTYLHCFANQLTSLDLSANTILSYLGCDNNQLTNLDLSTNTALTQLNCYSNDLTSLDVTANTVLIELRCHNNQLSSLNVRNGNNTSITTFNATVNPNLTCIDVDNVAWADSAWTEIDSWTSFSEDCSALDVLEEPILVTEFKLHDAYPNPFNPTTRISYDLPDDANVSITIYDLMGRKIRTLVKEKISAGYHASIWNARNDMGSSVAAGVYIYTITANDYRDVKKMILLK